MAQGYTVKQRCLVVCHDHPRFGTSPDGVLDSLQLLEVNCPLKSSMSLVEFLCQPNGGIRCLEDGKMMQSCKLVIWTPREHLELDISFDKDFTDTHRKDLQNFSHMLPTLVDQFVARKIQLCPKYLKLLKMQFSR